MRKRLFTAGAGVVLATASALVLSQPLHGQACLGTTSAAENGWLAARLASDAIGVELGLARWSPFVATGIYVREKASEQSGGRDWMEVWGALVTAVGAVEICPVLGLEHFWERRPLQLGEGVHRHRWVGGGVGASRSFALDQLRLGPYVGSRLVLERDVYWQESEGQRLVTYQPTYEWFGWFDIGLVLSYRRIYTRLGLQWQAGGERGLTHRRSLVGLGLGI